MLLLDRNLMITFFEINSAEDLLSIELVLKSGYVSDWIIISYCAIVQILAVCCYSPSAARLGYHVEGGGPLRVGWLHDVHIAQFLYAGFPCCFLFRVEGSTFCSAGCGPLLQNDFVLDTMLWAFGEVKL